MSRRRRFGMSYAEAGSLGDKRPGARARLKKIGKAGNTVHMEKMRAAKKAKAEEAKRRLRAFVGHSLPVTRQPDYGLTPSPSMGAQGYGDFKHEQYVACTCDGPARPDPHCPRESHRRNYRTKKEVDLGAKKSR
jgi:hypothetical protein